jgi:uncharacterized protein YjbI with pentapeptide repeats
VANEGQLEIIRKGVEAWNEWRKANPELLPDLSGAHLVQVFLGGANFSGADLSRADFSNANLSSADLRETSVIGANLSLVRLSRADLRGADLRGTNLTGAILDETDLGGSIAGVTFFSRGDLSKTQGLETVRHSAPSEISISTIYLSQGKIPFEFLRGAGVPDNFIEYMRFLNGATFELYSCFISYSSRDQEFAEQLHADLRKKNVRCWFAPEDLKIGDKLRPAFDEAIRVHDKLMVLLSENSVSSPWVEKEVETAFEKERQEKRTVLFPIRLDDSVMETKEAWAADIRRGRHIGDFRDWKNQDSYKKAFDRLLRDLKA